MTEWEEMNQRLLVIIILNLCFHTYTYRKMFELSEKLKQCLPPYPIRGHILNKIYDLIKHESTVIR